MGTGTQPGWGAPRVQTPQQCFAWVEWEQAFGYHKTAHGIEMERVHRPSSLSGSNTEHCKDHTWLLKQRFSAARNVPLFLPVQLSLVAVSSI